MKTILKNLFAGLMAAVVLTACNDFLNCPEEDKYNVDNFYKTEDQCRAGVNYLYGTTWYEFQRSLIKLNECLSGNYIWEDQSSKAWNNFTVKGDDANINEMSRTLWGVVAHANTVYRSLEGSPVDEEVRNHCQAECLIWKAMAYFYLVRSFGDIPIIHSNTETLAGDYNNVKKVRREDVYEYIIMTLETAMAKMDKAEGVNVAHMDYYCAEALLAKVYLTRAGVSGQLNADDLSKAAEYAKDVIENSGRELEQHYEDIFLLKNRYTPESLITWRWTADGTGWGRGNGLQEELAAQNLSGLAGWGEWGGFTYDMMLAFGVDLTKHTPDRWLNNPDTRLHATMMLPGARYSQFWQDKGGLEYLNYIFGDNPDAAAQFPSCTGANSVKHLYGNNYDHIQGCGVSAVAQLSSVPTYLLRLSDVYLMYAEAMTGVNRQATADALAVRCYNAVHRRAVPGDPEVASVTWEQIWKERRLEFCMEGDRFYDYVRLSYHDCSAATAELKACKRNKMDNAGITAAYMKYYLSNYSIWDNSTISYDDKTPSPNVENMVRTDSKGRRYLVCPMSQSDITFNPNLSADVEGVEVDVRKEYGY